MPIRICRPNHCLLSWVVNSKFLPYYVATFGTRIDPVRLLLETRMRRHSQCDLTFVRVSAIVRRIWTGIVTEPLTCAWNLGATLRFGTQAVNIRRR